MENISDSEIEDFCRRHRIAKLALFGSAVREDFAADSDFDILYEFEQGYSPGWTIVPIKKELEALLGREVDMISFKYLNRHIRDQVLAEARILHDAA